MEIKFLYEYISQCFLLIFEVSPILQNTIPLQNFHPSNIYKFKFIVCVKGKIGLFPSCNILHQYGFNLMLVITLGASYALTDFCFKTTINKQ